MKRILIAVLFLLITTSFGPMSSFAATAGGAGCKAQSWSPEVITLYGDQSAIMDKLDKYNLDLPNRRVYITMVESEKGAEATYYEKGKDGKVRVTKWKGASAADLREQLHRSILSNKGVNCVGEQSKALFAKETGANPEVKAEEVPAPVNGKAAVRHALKDNGSDYLRVTFFLMC